MYGLYQSKGLLFYRIASKESPETLKQFTAKEFLKVPVLVDKSSQTERLFGVWVHPTSYLINRQSLVCYRAMGAFDWTGVQATSVIDQLLKER